MNFLRKILPEDALESRKYLSPSTAINLDNEICGLLWIAYYFLCIKKILPSGIQFEVHVGVINEEPRRNDEPARDDSDDEGQGVDDDEEDEDEEDEFTDEDEDDGGHQIFDVNLTVIA
jgi:hypothetical protein